MFSFHERLCITITTNEPHNDLFMLIINHCHYNIFVRIENNRFLCYGYNSGNEYGSTGRPLVWIVRICCIKGSKYQR